MSQDARTTDQVRIEYDDDQLAVVDKINEVLKVHGLVLADDDLSHDGYCIFTLQAIQSRPGAVR